MIYDNLQMKTLGHRSHLSWAKTQKKVPIINSLGLYLYKKSTDPTHHYILDSVLSSQKQSRF